jgi:hypothetical protein
MKGSGPKFTKPISSKTKKATGVPIQMPPIPEASTDIPQPAENFEKFLELPPELQSTILSKGLVTSGLRPSQQLQLAATTLPSIVRSVEFLLPTKVTAIFIKNYRNTEEKEFKTAREITEYISQLYQEASTSGLDSIQLTNNYVRVIIVNKASRPDGYITISALVPNSQIAMASFTINFTRMKNQYDMIMLSKVQLMLYLNQYMDFEYLKEMFIGVRWLSLVFKKITWQKGLLQFEDPNNVKVYLNNIATELKDIDQDVVQKALLLLKYLEKSLAPRRATRRGTTRRA